MGAFMTALDMAGLSLSLLLVDDARLARLDAPTLAPAWPAGIAAHVPGKAPLPLRRGLPEPPAAATFSTTDDPADPELGKAVRHALAHAAASLMPAAPKLDELDSRCRLPTREDLCYVCVLGACCTVAGSSAAALMLAGAAACACDPM